MIKTAAPIQMKYCSPIESPTNTFHACSQYVSSKIQDGGPAAKIVTISLQWLNQFWWNSARWCVLSIDNPLKPAVKISNFAKTTWWSAIVKIEKLRYLGLTSFNKIHHCHTYRPSGLFCRPLKFQLQKSKMDILVCIYFCNGAYCLEVDWQYIFC